MYTYRRCNDEIKNVPPIVPKRPKAINPLQKDLCYEHAQEKEIDNF